MDWSIFYSVAAGASATLLGLLFVAVQMHLRTLTTDPSSRWRALARSTFINYTNLFMFSALMLFPTIGRAVYGFVLLFVVGFGVYRLLITWLPVWRGVFRGRSERIVSVLWWLISPMIVYLVLGALAIQALRAGQTPDIQQNVGYCVMGLFAIVLRNSWNLLFELPPESPASP